MITLQPLSPLQIAICYWRSNLRNMLGACEKVKNGTFHRMMWVDQWASEVEGSASLDFLVLHEVWSDNLLENNLSYINKLSFYHSIRWHLIFFWYYASNNKRIFINSTICVYFHSP